MLAVSDTAVTLGVVGGIVVALAGVLWCFLIQFRREASVRSVAELRALGDESGWKELIDKIAELILNAPKAMLPGFLMIVLGGLIAVGVVIAQSADESSSAPDTPATSTTTTAP